MFPTGIRFIRGARSEFSVTVASSVRVQGQLVPSRGMQDVELLAKNVTLLGESPEAPDKAFEKVTGRPRRTVSRANPDRSRSQRKPDGGRSR